MKLNYVFQECLQSDEAEVREAIWAGEILPDPSVDPDSSSQFSVYVEKLTKLFGRKYLFAVVNARHAKESEEEAAYWKIMIQFYEAVLSSLAPLKEKFPNCGTVELYNMLSQYMAVFKLRHAELLEENACQADLLDGVLSEADLLELAQLAQYAIYPIAPLIPTAKETARKFNDFIEFLYQSRVSKLQPLLTLEEFRCIVRRRCKASINEPYREMDKVGFKTGAGSPAWDFCLKPTVFEDSVL